MSEHPNARLLDGWRHYFSRSHQIGFSVQLEPKWQFWSAAILVCIMGIWWESCHDFGIETKLVFTEVPSGTCIFKRNMHPMTSSLATHHKPSFQRSEQLQSSRTLAMPNVGVSHGITASLVKSQIFSELLKPTWMWLTQEGRKTPDIHVNLTPNNNNALNDDNYKRFQFIHCMAGMETSPCC